MSKVKKSRLNVTITRTPSTVMPYLCMYFEIPCQIPAATLRSEIKRIKKGITI